MITAALLVERWMICYIRYRKAWAEMQSAFHCSKWC